MTAAEFEAVRPFLKISEDRIDAARSFLVHGQTLSATANVYGWTNQAVDNAVGIVWETLESYHESQRALAKAVASLPPGWEQATLIAPKHLIAKFRAEIAGAIAESLLRSNRKASIPDPQ